MLVLRSKWVVFIVLLSCLLLGTVFVWDIGYNTSQSMPRGFYYKVHSSTIHRGDTVAACLTWRWSRIGLERHYLQAGRCVGGAAPVLKRVIAIPGDVVSVTKKGMLVNSVYINAPLQEYDHQGLKIEYGIQAGVQVSHGYWLYGSGSPKDSWDSRYWGSIQFRQVIGVYKSVFSPSQVG